MTMVFAGRGNALSVLHLACAVAAAPARAQQTPLSPVSSIRVTGMQGHRKPDRDRSTSRDHAGGAGRGPASQNARQVDAVLAAVAGRRPAAVLRTSSYSLNPNLPVPPTARADDHRLQPVNVVQVTPMIGKIGRSSTARRLPGPITCRHPVHAARSGRGARRSAAPGGDPGARGRPRCSPRRSD